LRYGCRGIDAPVHNKQLDSIPCRQQQLNVTAHLFRQMWKWTVCCLSANIATINADNILGYSKGISVQIYVLHEFRNSRNPSRTNT